MTDEVVSQQNDDDLWRSRPRSGPASRAGGPPAPGPQRPARAARLAPGRALLRLRGLLHGRACRRPGHQDLPGPGRRRSRSTRSRALFSGQYRLAFVASIEVSVTSAVIGTLFGLFVAYAAVRGRGPRWIQPLLTTFCGVASNFAGIPLAFAFIATLGPTGVVTVLLANLGLKIYAHGFTIFSLLGLSLVYVYFQLPLMILVIAPSIEGLREEWREAAENLGATQPQYWWHVGLPVLLPSLAGALVLLFGNAFSAYATPYALASGGITLVPILIGYGAVGRRRRHQPAPGRLARLRHDRDRRLHGAALLTAATEGGQVAPVEASIATTTAGEALTRHPQRKKAAKRHMSFWTWFWLIMAALYFLVPLFSTPQFSLETSSARLRLQVVRGHLPRPHVPHELLLLAAPGGRDRDHRPRAHGADRLLGAPQAAAAAAGHGHRLDPAVRGAAGGPRGRPLRRLPGHAVAARELAPPRLAVRHPGAALHLSLARRRHERDQRAHADRGGPELRRAGLEDPAVRDPAEHPHVDAERGLPHLGHRDGRVHDLESAAVPDASRSTSTTLATPRRNRPRPSRSSASG